MEKRMRMGEGVDPGRLLNKVDLLVQITTSSPGEGPGETAFPTFATLFFMSRSGISVGQSINAPNARGEVMCSLIIIRVQFLSRVGFLPESGIYISPFTRSEASRTSRSPHCSDQNP